MNGVNAPPAPVPIVVDLGIRAAVFALLWWAVLPAEPDSWIVGVPLVIAAALLSRNLLPLRRTAIRPFGLLRFIGYFLVQSLLSSFDVARRVFVPRLDIQPGIVRYPLHLTAPSARVIVANTCSLLPGTLSIDIDGDMLVVHVLDVTAPVMADLTTLERRVAAIYGIRLSEVSS